MLNDQWGFLKILPGGGGALGVGSKESGATVSYTLMALPTICRADLSVASSAPKKNTPRSTAPN